MHRLRYLFFPALALGAVFMAGGRASAQTGDQNPTPRIVVQGQGIVSTKPDLAILVIGATVRADNAADAFNRAEQRVSALTDALKADGVPDSDIQTRQFSLNPEFGRSDNNNPPPLTGWRATHTVAVKLRDFSTIGKVIDDAVAALGGDATIQGISFTIENSTAAAAQARTAAIHDAQTKAQQMASDAGVTLGRILLITETSAPPPTPLRADVAAAPAAAQVAQISPGEMNVTVTVQVTFAIQ